jgi:hypothetical protein
MIRSIGKLTLVTILTAVVLGLPIAASAQNTPAPTPAAPATPDAKPKATRFSGKLEAVDKVNKTITVGVDIKRVVDVTSTTKITKAGKPATLDDGVVGEDISVSYIKTGDGATAKYTARFIRFGAAMKKPEAPSTPATAPK